MDGDLLPSRCLAEGCKPNNILEVHLPEKIPVVSGSFMYVADSCNTKCNCDNCCITVVFPLCSIQKSSPLTITPSAEQRRSVIVSVFPRLLWSYCSEQKWTQHGSLTSCPPLLLFQFVDEVATDATAAPMVLDIKVLFWNLV